MGPSLRWGDEFPPASVHRAAHLAVAEQGDHAGGLAPAAEVEDVAELAAAARAQGRLARRMLAESGDELGGVGQGFPAGERRFEVQAFPLFSRAGGSSAEPL